MHPKLKANSSHFEIFSRCGY